MVKIISKVVLIFVLEIFKNYIRIFIVEWALISNLNPNLMSSITPNVFTFGFLL